MFRLALLAALVGGLAPAAPLPPPRKLSAELLAGKRWDCTWGTSKDRYFYFLPDGSYWYGYVERITIGDDKIEVVDVDHPTHVGCYLVRGNELLIEEGWFQSDHCVQFNAQYQILFDMADCPVLVGKASTGFRVELSNPRP